MAKLHKGKNDLASQRPDLAKEWHPTKNGKLKPEDVTLGSGTKVWWLVSYDVPDDDPCEKIRGKHFDFEWQSYVRDRAKKGQGCPFLSGARVWPTFNDLKTRNERLAREWDYSRNKGFVNRYGKDISTPNKVTESSDNVVWWRRKYKDPDTEKVYEFHWKESIKNRSGQGKAKGFAKNCCPFIPPKASKQECKMFEFLMDNNIDFQREQKYNITVDDKRSSSRFDVYLPSMNAVIELDGQQHFHKGSDDFEAVRKSEEQIKLDNERNEYCKENGIKILRIPHYVSFEKQNEYVKTFVETGKIPDELINTYKKYDFSNYADVATQMNDDSFKSASLSGLMAMDNSYATVVTNAYDIGTRVKSAMSTVPDEDKRQFAISMMIKAESEQNFNKELLEDALAENMSQGQKQDTPKKSRAKQAENDVAAFMEPGEMSEDVTLGLDS